MLPNVNMRLGVTLVRDFDLEVLSDRGENRAHIWVAEVHFERVATFLLEMDRRLAVAGMMALPMCRRDIGDYLGLTLETVSRALSQLHTQGVLGFSGARQIVLRNRQRLRNMDA